MGGQTLIPKLIFLSVPFLGKTSPSQNLRVTTLPSFSDHFLIKLELIFKRSDLVLSNPRYFTSYKKQTGIVFAMIWSFPVWTACILNIEIFKINKLIPRYRCSTQFLHLYIISTLKSLKFAKNKPPIKRGWQGEKKFSLYRMSQEYRTISAQIQLLNAIIKEILNMKQGKIFNSKLQKIRPGPTAFKEIYHAIGNKNSSFHDITINNIEIKLNRLIGITKNAGERIPMGEQKTWHKSISILSIRLESAENTNAGCKGAMIPLGG